MDGLIGITAMYSAELIQINFLNSQTSNPNMLMFAIFECTCGLVTVIVTMVAYFFLTKQYGTLYIYYRTVQIYTLAIVVIFVAPFAFNDVPEHVYYGALWSLCSLVCACSAVMALVAFTFTNNACYNHEKVVVNRTGIIFFVLGLLCGSYIASSLFSFSEWLRNEFSIRVQVAWLLPVVISRLLLLIAKRLPKKIQRSMREPLKPRYAVSMQSDGDNLLGYQVNEDGDDSVLENMENTLSSNRSV